MIRLILTIVIMSLLCTGLATIRGTPLDAVALPLGLWVVGVVVARPVLLSYEAPESSTGVAAGLLSLAILSTLFGLLGWAAFSAFAGPAPS